MTDLMSRPQSQSIISLYLDMHGLVFKTSIWLLAGSTRLLVVNQAENPKKFRGSETLTELMLINCASCGINATLRSEEFFSHTNDTAINAYSKDLLSQGTFTVIASITDTVLQAIKPQHMHWCENDEFVRRTNTNSQNTTQDTCFESSLRDVKVIWFIAYFTNWN